MGAGASSTTDAPRGVTVTGGTELPPQLETSAVTGLPGASDEVVQEQYEEYEDGNGSLLMDSKREFTAPKPRQRHLKYSVGKIIGHGSFGQVYLALEHLTGKLLAVKEMVIKNCNREMLEAVDAETRILVNLRHPNIVKIYDIEVSDDASKLLIVMDYIAGGSLTSLAKSFRGIPEILCRRYTRQILEAIKHMHSLNVAHLDLKCSNIMIGGDGLVKLVDFGTATRLSREEIMTELERRATSGQRQGGVSNMENSKRYNLGIKGSPYWIAPECVKSTLYEIFKADIWSLGCLVMEMFTTYPPFFQFKQVPALLYHIATITEPPNLPDNISAEGRDFLSKCLQIDPEKRYNVEQLLDHPWVSLVNLSFDIHPLIPDKPSETPQATTLAQSIDAGKNLTASKADKILNLFGKGKSDSEVTQSTIAKNWFGKSRSSLAESLINIKTSSKLDVDVAQLDELFEVTMPPEDFAFLIAQHDRVLEDLI